MIALDTNALLRLLVEDDEAQAQMVRQVVTVSEKTSELILILPEVLIETVWVLESVYQCNRIEIFNFLEMVSEMQVFTFPDRSIIRSAGTQYKKGGDFADQMIVAQAKKQQARKIFSFDKKLQKRFPEYVVGSVSGLNPTQKN